MRVKSKKINVLEIRRVLEEIVSEFSEYKRLAQGTNKCDLIIRAENLLEKLP